MTHICIEFRNKTAVAATLSFCYRADSIFFVPVNAGFCHSQNMRNSRNKRALIPLAVILRLTAMDVCCGPPAPVY